ncbi:unnamed protein product [Amoebophrya sp. A25]|nr:unnamed protein product [Amoebophrya sp. A25]|eukprot:GSA25T00021779001.1
MRPAFRCSCTVFILASLVFQELDFSIFLSDKDVTVPSRPASTCNFLSAKKKDTRGPYHLNVVEDGPAGPRKQAKAVSSHATFWGKRRFLGFAAAQAENADSHSRLALRTLLRNATEFYQRWPSARSVLHRRDHSGPDANANFSAQQERDSISINVQDAESSFHKTQVEVPNLQRIGEARKWYDVPSLFAQCGLRDFGREFMWRSEALTRPRSKSSLRRSCWGTQPRHASALILSSLTQKLLRKKCDRTWTASGCVHLRPASIWVLTGRTKLSASTVSMMM